MAPGFRPFRWFAWIDNRVLFDSGWTFAGTVQEATVAYLLGADLANSGAWPTWNTGNESKPLRDKLKQRGGRSRLYPFFKPPARP